MQDRWRSRRCLESAKPWLRPGPAKPGIVLIPKSAGWPGSNIRSASELGGLPRRKDCGLESRTHALSRLGHANRPASPACSNDQWAFSLKDETLHGPGSFAR